MAHVRAAAATVALGVALVAAPAYGDDVLGQRCSSTMVVDPTSPGISHLVEVSGGPIAVQGDGPGSFARDVTLTCRLLIYPDAYPPREITVSSVRVGVAAVVLSHVASVDAGFSGFSYLCQRLSWTDPDDGAPYVEEECGPAIGWST